MKIPQPLKKERTMLDETYTLANGVKIPKL